MLAMNAAPGIATRQNGSRGLTVQTRSAAMPIAMNGNCQTQAEMVTFLVSPKYNAYAISPIAGSQSHGAQFMRRCHQVGRNFSIAARTTPNTSGSSRVQVG